MQAVARRGAKPAGQLAGIVPLAQRDEYKQQQAKLQEFVDARAELEKKITAPRSTADPTAAAEAILAGVPELDPGELRKKAIVLDEAVAIQEKKVNEVARRLSGQVGNASPVAELRRDIRQRMLNAFAEFRRHVEAEFQLYQEFAALGFDPGAAGIDPLVHGGGTMNALNYFAEVLKVRLEQTA